MINDTEYLFMYRVAICVSSMKKMSLQIFSPSFGGLFSIELQGSLYILFISSLSDDLETFFLSYKSSFFIFVNTFPCHTEAFGIMMLNLFILLLFLLLFNCPSKKSPQDLCQEAPPIMFSSGVLWFQVLHPF